MVYLAPLEEEASTEQFPVLEPLRNSARNSGFACASHPLQPEYALATRVLCPLLYLLKKFDSSIWMTSCIVLMGVRIEYCVFRDGKFGEVQFLANVEYLCTDRQCQPK